MTNYEKASILLSLGYASKLDKAGCLTFDLGYNTSSFGFIYLLCIYIIKVKFYLFYCSDCIKINTWHCDYMMYNVIRNKEVTSTTRTGEQNNGMLWNSYRREREKNKAWNW